MYNYSIYYYNKLNLGQNFEDFLTKNNIKHSQFYETNSFFGPEAPNEKVHIELNNMTIEELKEKLKKENTDFSLYHIFKYNKLYDNQ